MKSTQLSFVFALSCAATGLASPLFAQRGGASSDLITRIYDMRSASPLLSEAGGGVRLAPYLRPWDEDNSPQEPSSAFDEVASIVLQTFEGEFQYEGRALEMLDGQRLKVTAPAATQKDVATLIQFLEQGFRRSVTIRIDWVDRPADAPLAQPLLPYAEADKLVAAATHARRSTLSVQPGRDASFSAQRTYELVQDYDVEIAQAATIADPVVGSFQVGADCTFRAAETTGGVLLAAVVSDGAPARPPRKVDVDIGAFITSERGADRISAPASFESLSVLHGSFALSLFVPDGQAAVIDLGCNLRTGARRGALILRREGPSQDPLSSCELPAQKARVDLLDATWFVPPTVQYSGSLEFLPSTANLQSWWTDYSESIYLRSGDPWEFAHTLEDGERAVVNVGPWLVVYGGAPNPPKLAGSPRLANPPAPECAGAWFRLRRDGAVVAQWSLPLVSGLAQRFAIGGETWSVVEADVEVAQSSATMDPKMGSRLDGVLGTVTGSRAQDGAWSLDLSLLAHVLAADSTSFSTGSVLRMDIDRNEFDDLRFYDRVVLGGPAGPRTRTIGMSGALELEVELR